jgi:hypothetical protein
MFSQQKAHEDELKQTFEEALEKSRKIDASSDVKVKKRARITLWDKKASNTLAFVSGFT